MPEMEWSSQLNVVVALMALILSTTLALNLRVGRARMTLLARFSEMLYLCLFLFAGANLLGQLLNGATDPFARVILPVACYCDYFFSGALAFMASAILITLLDPKREYVALRWCFFSIVALHVLLLTVSQFNGMFYIIDAQNVYLRSELYWLSLVPVGMMLVVDAGLLLHNGKTLERADRQAFWFFLLIPAAALVLQISVENIVPIAATVASLGLYIYLSKRQYEEFYRSRKENAELRAEIMLSQIQPHFLFNSLGAIADLCESDAHAAKQTTLKFSQYLHGVMETLNTTRLVDFSRELAQTKLYLELEQVRFGDALQVRYEIGCSGFLLPPLSLQPLVENAVRHGVRKNPDGRGTVIVRSTELPEAYTVSVIDDGPGFNRQLPPDRERMHVGLSNVRERVQMLCGGRVEIVSAPGEGTEVCIRIPKGGSKAC